MNPKTVEAESITTKRDALALLKALGRTFDENEIVIRYARRELALYKDRERRKSGAPAASIYLPSNTDALPKKMRIAVSALADLMTAPAEKAAPKKAQPAPAKKAASKKAQPKVENVEHKE